MKNFILLTLIVLGVFGCKEDEDIDPNGESGEKSAEVFYTIPLMNEAKAVYASPNGNMLISEIPDGTRNKYRASKDAGVSWVDIPVTDLQGGMTITNEGLCIPTEKANLMFHIDNPSFFISSIDVFRNKYYAGWEKDLFRLENVSSQIPYPTLFSYDFNSNTWDTLNNRMDTIGQYIGQDHRGGIAFLNTIQSRNRLNIYVPSNNTWISLNCNIDVGAVQQGQSNRQPTYAYNGYDKVLFAYTKGFGVSDLTTNTTSYTDWEEGYKGYYENPFSATISRQGNVYAELRSYVRPAITAKYNAGSSTMQRISTRSIPNCSGNYTYLMYESLAVKSSSDKDLEISSLNTAEGTMSHAHVTGSKIYSLVYTDAGTQKTSLIIHDRGKNMAEVAAIGGILKFVYADENKIFVTGGGLWQYSEDGGNTWEVVAPENAVDFTQIKKIGGTYYGMSVFEYKYRPGGTGFQFSRFNYTMYTSSDLKNWTILPGADHKGKGGEGPESFTEDGVLTYTENTNPLGNASYQYYTSIDFGKTWNNSSEPITTVNVSTTFWDYYLYVGYSGPGEVTKTQVSKTFERGNSVKYNVSGPSAVASRVAQVGESGQLYYFTGSSILELP